MKATASSRSMQIPLSGVGVRVGGGGGMVLGMCYESSISINSHAIGRGNNNLLNRFSTSNLKCIDNYVIKKSVPAMAAIYGTYTTDNVYMQLQNNDAASVASYIDEQKLLQ